MRAQEVFMVSIKNSDIRNRRSMLENNNVGLWESVELQNLDKER